jgi:hypothetical protein
MRISLLVAGLLVLGACSPTPQMTAQNNRVNLNKYIQPTNGAAYSQSDLYYYKNNVNPGYQGPSGLGAGVHHP